MSPQHKNNSTNFKTSLQSITSAVTAMKGIKAGAYIGSNGLFDSATVNAYRASIKGLSATQAEAALSASGLNAAQRQQILTSKESTVANAGQATSFNVLTKAVWANVKAMAKWLVTTPTGWITLAIGATVGLITAYNNVEKKQNELIENARNLQEEYRSFAKDTAGKISSLEGQAEEFNKLAKGVDKYGNNISLASDEYDRYKSIVAEILGYSPELIQGYDAEGNAIADKNGLLERSIELLKEEQRLKLKEMTTDEKTGEAYDAAEAGWQQVQGYEGANTRNQIARWFDDNALRGGVNYEVDIAKVLGIKDEWKEEGNNLQNAIINNIDTVVKNIKDKKEELLAISDSDGNAVFSVDEIDNMIDLSNDWQYAYNQWQQDIEDAKHGMDDQFDLYAQRAKSYNDLTDAQKVFVNEYIRATGDITDAEGHLLSEDKILEKAKGYEKFVNEFAELNKLGEGGSVDLTFRPEIDTEELNKKGWEAGEGFATVFSSAISNTDFDDLIPENAEDTVAINFTPIIVDPNTGEFKGVLSEEELYAYAHDVLAGVREDDLNLQIGAKFEGKNAIDEAVADGERIHYLHEKLFINNDTVDSWEELRKVLVKTGDDAVQAGENANKMTVSLSELEKTSDNIKTLSSAFKELSDDGYITTKTLGEIKIATGLADDEWEEYETRLLSTKKGSSDFNQVMSDLTYKILDATFKKEGLVDATEDEIAAVLRENGVSNASAVAHDYLARTISSEEKAKAENSIRTRLLSGDIAGLIKNLSSEATACGLTETAFKNLAIQMVLTNETNMSFDDQIANLKALGVAAEITAAKMAGVNGYRNTKYSGKRNAHGNMDSRGGLIVDVGQETINGSTYIVYYGENGQVVDKEKIGGDYDNITTPKIPTYTSDGKSGSDKNKPDYEDPADAIINRINLRADELAQQEEEIQNLIEIAELENDYKKQISSTNDLIDKRKERLSELENAKWWHHNEAEYLRNSTPQWNEEEWFDSQGNETEAYTNFINNRITAGADKEEIESIKDQFEKISKYKKAWIDADNEIAELNKQLLQDAENLNELYSSQHENTIRDIEHARDMALEANPFADTTLYNKQLQEEYHKEAERLRAIDAEKYKEEIQELQRLWWDARNEMSEWRYDVSQRWIEDRNTYGDWELFGDSEVEAWERVVKWLRAEYPEDLDKIRDAEASLFEARKKLVDDLISELESKINADFDIRISRLNSKSSLLSSHFNIVNAIAEEQHNLNKELREAETIGARMSELERKTLFSKADHNRLSSKLSDIMFDINDLQSDYLRDLEHATEDTIEEVTNQYERQYELKMKEYEVVKAELNLIKKRQILENTQNEKSVRTWNGSEWIYEANLQDVLNAQEEVENAKHELARARSEEAQQTALNAIDASADALQTEKNKLTSAIKDMAEKMSGSGKEITSMLQTLAETDLPTFDAIVKAFGDSIKEVANISDEDINKYRSDSVVLETMKARSNAWFTANESERNALAEANLIDGKRLGLTRGDDGVWRKKDGSRAYASGTSNAKKGWGLFDDTNKGFGSEVILTNDGILTQFNGGERVFSPEMADRLWEMAQKNNILTASVPQFDFSKLVPIEERINNAINNISNVSGDTYMIKDVQLSEPEGGEIKGFINFLKRKVY